MKLTSYSPDPSKQFKASLEPVPYLEQVLCVSTSEEVALSRNTGSRVAPTPCWSKRKNREDYHEHL